MTGASSFNARWLMEQVFPPTKYVVPGIIPEGMTVLAAAPKVGKSWMVLGLGVELSIGGQAFGGLPVGEPRPVLYLALEDGQRRLQDRLAKLNPPEFSDRLHFRTCLDGGSVTETIGDFMMTHRGLDPVVILDTLGRVMPASSGNENSYVHDYKALSALKAKCDEVPGSSLIVVHHTRKSDAVDFLDAVSGTHGIAGAADTVIVLRRDRHTKRATLQVTSRDTEEGEYALMMTDAGAWELVGDDLAAATRAAESTKRTAGVGTRMAAVVEAVGRKADGVTLKELRATLSDIPSKQLDKYLSRAVESGRLVRLTRGLYALSGPSGVSVPRDDADTTDTPDTC